ncbi:MAG TPA: 3'-5' exonuclease, partial [Planctomycetota bacterium]
EVPMPEEVIAVHGITDGDVAQSPTAADVLPEFFAWTGNLPLLAHNAPFDAAMLASECARLGLQPPACPVLCTLKAARKLLKLRSHSLVNLVRELGLPTARHHRATDDAQHALNLLWRLQESVDPAFHVSALGHGRDLGSYQADPPRLPLSRRLLSEAAESGDAVDIVYRLPSQHTVSARVSPRYFFRRSGAILMEALCHQALHYKCYRLERIAAAHPCFDAPPVHVRRLAIGA